MKQNKTTFKHEWGIEIFNMYIKLSKNSNNINGMERNENKMSTNISNKQTQVKTLKYKKLISKQIDG